MKQTCAQCQFQFHLTSQRFYCCNQNTVVCSTCRRKQCPKCKKPRTTEIVIPKCNKCFSRLYSNDLLLQYNCGRYYCSKCLSEIFRAAYIKVSVDRQFQGKDVQLAVRLYCGHEFLYEQLLQFFQHFCLACGREYDSVLDYELNDGVKLCFMCFRYDAKLFAQLFIKCEFCQTVIKNSSNASILENSDMAICQKCTMESKMSENLISESRKKIQEQQSFEKISPKNQQKVQQVKNIEKFPVKVPEPQPDKGQQKSPSIPKSPLSKLFKKPSISQLKQKQQKRANNNKSNSISITSRFSNNFEDIDQEITQSLGLPQDFKLKKHLSNQTYVENYLIEIPQNKPNEFVQCRKCCCSIEAKVAYNLYDIGQEMGKSKATTVSLKLNGSMAEISNKENTYFICRVCYLKSSQREKSIMNASTSTRAKSSMSSRPSKLEESTSTMDYLKPGKSSRKDMRSPSPSPNKQYSLTGSKQPTSLKETKSSLLEPQPSMKNFQQTTSKVFYPMSRQTSGISQSIPQRLMKCELCRGMKKSLIATTQGYLCDECYYKKSPYYDPFLSR